MFAPPTRSQCRIWWVALTGLSIALIAALVVGVILLVGSVLSFLSPVLVPVAVAGILAYLIHPAVVWLENRGLNRGRAILILFAVGTLVLTGIGLLVIPDLIQQGVNLYHNRTEIFERAHETIDKGLKPFGFSLETSEATTGVIDWFKSDENLAAIGRFIMNQMSGVIGMIGYIFGILLIPIYLFVFLKESSSITRSWTDYIPLRASRFKDEIVATLTEFNQYLIAFFRGQLLVSIIDGVLTGIALAIMGLPYAVVIGFGLATVGVIPYVGIIVTYVPALLIAIAHFENWQGPLAVTIIFFAVQQIDGLLIQPRIVGDSVGLHPVTVIFSVLFWSLILGVLLGALLAVPLTASVKVLFRRYIWKRQLEDGGSDKPPDDEPHEPDRSPAAGSLSLSTKPDMSLTIYTYSKCSTCRKATDFLRQHDIIFEERPIRETPPGADELKRMAAHYDGQWRRLFNTSGMDYRAMNLGKKLDRMSEQEKIDLLLGNGNLVKRPFLLGELPAADGSGQPPPVALVGFREDQWRTALGMRVK